MSWPESKNQRDHPLFSIKEGIREQWGSNLPLRVFDVLLLQFTFSRFINQYFNLYLFSIFLLKHLRNIVAIMLACCNTRLFYCCSHIVNVCIRVQVITFLWPLMSVGLSVSWSVCHYFLREQKVTLPCSYQSTCCNYDR